MSLEYLLTSLLVVASPGTGVLYTVGTALTHGRRASMLAALGSTLGIVPHMAAAMTGLAAVLHGSVLAFEILRYAGVAYLVFMAWSTLRDRGPLRLDADRPTLPPLQTIRSGIGMNLLNPKLSIFFMAFLPQFVTADDAAPVLSMLRLGLVFMAITLAVFVAYGLGAAMVRHHLIASAAAMAWMCRCVAVAFVGLGVRLAFASR